MKNVYVLISYSVDDAGSTTIGLYSSSKAAKKEAKKHCRSAKWRKIENDEINKEYFQQILKINDLDYLRIVEMPIQD